MGTSVSQNDEWIELRNTSATGVPLEGWTLSDGGSLTIPLSGTISGNGYFLLERTDDDTVAGVSASLLYTGALANDGRTLTLTDASGSVVDSVAGGQHWESIGGNNATKDTPQRTSSGWVTGTPTPKAANISAAQAAQEDDEDEEETQSGTHTDEDEEEEDDEEASVRISMMKTPRTEAISIGEDRTVHAGRETVFEAIPQGISPFLEPSVVYTWNFGDGNASVGKKVSHAFLYPGEYVVYAEAHFSTFKAEARITVTVLPVDITITLEKGGILLFHNDSLEEMDISGYVVEDGAQSFVFPKNTIILSQSTLTLLPIMLKRIAFSEAVSVRTIHGNLITLKDHGEAHEEEEVVAQDPPPVVSSHPAPMEAGKVYEILVAERASSSAPRLTDTVAEESLPAAAGTTSLPWYATFGGLFIVILCGVVALFVRRPRPVQKVLKIERKL